MVTMKGITVMSETVFTAAVITVSDKGFRGEREDRSGPALCDFLREHGWQVIHTAIVPDNTGMIQKELLYCADELHAVLILTSGGTGFAPTDITPEATLALGERLVPGIPEAMRAASMQITPRGCLSRETAVIRGRSLIVNLPGSPKAAVENFSAVVEPLRHGVEMLLSQGSADCAADTPAKKSRPSADQWLKEAKAGENADRIGMYLIHNGTVRTTARRLVRDGDDSVPPVTGMLFSCDMNKADAAIADARKMPGVYEVRVWLNEGRLQPGDDIMMVLIGADIRPHAVAALETVVGRLKKECVTEQELYD